MSFTGIFKAKNGIVAVVDSKASRVENGQSYEAFTEIQKSSLYSKTELQQLLVLTRS